jgi:hypothetical protein
VRDLGCCSAQGFYFSPPVDGDAARSLLARDASPWWEPAPPAAGGPPPAPRPPRPR